MLNLKDIPKMFDVTACQATSTLDELRECCDIANDLNVAVVFGNNCFIPQALEMINEDCTTVIGGGCGFPCGGETTAAKVWVAKEVLKMGVGEVDMTTNIGAMKSGLYDMYLDDIKAVLDVVPDGMTKKAIIEVSHLTDDEIRRAAELVVKGGADFVKTGTGWGPKPTTPEHIRLIKETIGDAAQIKAAGGVRDLDTLIAMYNEGATRFGIGIRSVRKILEEIEARS